MTRMGAILLAFLAIASVAKAEDVIYTGSKNIVVDLSVLGADEDIKLKPDEVPLTKPTTAAKLKETKPEKIILKKPPFTYKKPSYKKAGPAPAFPAPAPVQKPKAALPSPSLTPAAKPAAKPAAAAVAKPSAKPLTKPLAATPAPKKAPVLLAEKKAAKLAKVKDAPISKPAPKPTPKPAPAAKLRPESSPVPTPEAKPAIKENRSLAEAPAPLAAPVTSVEKSDISDIIAKSGHVIFFDFAPSATGLTAQNKKDLEEVANTVKADNRLAIRLIAYAKNPEFASSKARRTSLSRALTIRDFLLKEGIPTSKIEVRALGNRVQKDQVFLEILAEE